MVLVHSGAPTFLDKIISMFHMPLFFFMSGYCFKDKYLNTPITFIKRKIYGLYLPYIKWGMIFLILHNIFFTIGIYSINSQYNNYFYNFSDFIHRGLGILKFKYSEQLLGGYWFLPALFFCSIIAFFTLKIIKRSYISIILTLTIGFILGLLFKYNLHTFGLCEKWFIAASIYITGYTCFLKKFPPFNLWQTIIGIIFIVIGAIYWPMSMVSDYYSTPTIFLYVPTSLLGIWSIYSLCNIFQKNINGKLKSILLFIGENTMAILTWHFLCFKFINFLIVKAYCLPQERIGEHPTIIEYANIGWFIIYTFVGITFPLILILIRNKLKHKLICQTKSN